MKIDCHAPHYNFYNKIPKRIKSIINLIVPIKQLIQKKICYILKKNLFMYYLYVKYLIIFSIKQKIYFKNHKKKYVLANKQNILYLIFFENQYIL